MSRRLRLTVVALAAAVVGLLVAVAVTLAGSAPTSTRAEVYFAPGATLDASAHARVASYAALVDHTDGVRVRVLPDSLVVRLSATADDAGTARSRVQAATTRLQQRASSLETGTRGLTATVVDAGTLSTASRPWTRNLLIGLGVGLLLGLLLAMAAPRRARRLRGAEDVAAALPVWTVDDVPVAGQVAALVRLDDPTAAYPRLVDALPYLDVDVDGTTLVLAASRAGHDAAEVAARLATHLAASGRPVVLVDAGFSRPDVSGLLGLTGGPGLVAVLAGDASLEDAVVVHEATGLHVLPTGPEVPDPVSLAGSRTLQRVLEDLRRDHTTVLVVADPLDLGDAAAVAAGAADGLVLVLRQQVDTDADLTRVADLVESRGARLRGVALTTVAPPPAVRPLPATTDVAPPADAPPELLFPVVPDAEETTRRVPLQRVADPEPVAQHAPPVTQPDPQPDSEPSAEDQRLSLLDDFLGSEDPEPEPPVVEEPEPAATADSDTWPPSWDDDDTQSIWRPRAR